MEPSINVPRFTYLSFLFFSSLFLLSLLPSPDLVLFPKSWNTSRNDVQVAFVKFNIENEGIVVTEVGKGSSGDHFSAAMTSLKDKEPAYVAVRYQDKWVLMFFMPENCKVNLKMLYATCLVAFKTKLQTANFYDDFKISEIKECTLRDYENSKRTFGETELLTVEEKMAFEAHFSSEKSVENEMKVTVDVPIKVTKDAEAAIATFVQKKVTFVIVKLNGDTEELELDGSGNGSAEDVRASFPYLI